MTKPLIRRPSSHNRRQFLSGLACAIPVAAFGRTDKAAAVMVPAPAGERELDVDQLDSAIRLLQREVSIDLHSHPGAFFFNGIDTPEDPAIAAMANAAGFEDRTIADMLAGGLSTAVISTVSDAPLIGAGSQGLYAHREFQPGEAYA
ncbi:MAG: hypothetical protein ACC642_03615, partial [Pseudomonadales bacterium]